MIPTNIVFLPGFMCDQRLFGPQAEAIGQAGYKCHYGDVTRASSVEEIAEQVLAEAPKEFALVGLSMGGIIAFEIYRQAPDRVTHLALLNTTARSDTSRISRKKQLERVANGGLDQVLREELKPNYLAPQNKNKETLDILRGMGITLGKDVFSRQSIALMQRPNSVDGLKAIKCPTLVLTGAQDKVCPIHLQREIARSIPQSHLTILPDCGHISTLEQPRLVNQALLKLVSSSGALPHLNSVESYGEAYGTSAEQHC